MAISTCEARRGRVADHPVQRMDMSDLLNDEPGLQPEIPQAFEKAYRKARLLAANETGMDEETFPKQSPYSIEQTMADDFMPEGN